MRLEQILGNELTRQCQLYAASVPRAQAVPEKKRLEAIIRYALRDWMETIGQGHIEDALGVPNPILDRMVLELEGVTPAPVPSGISRMN
jgi:hypothetical protein